MSGSLWYHPHNLPPTPSQNMYWWHGCFLLSLCPQPLCNICPPFLPGLQIDHTHPPSPTLAWINFLWKFLNAVSWIITETTWYFKSNKGLISCAEITSIEAYQPLFKEFLFICCPGFSVSHRGLLSAQTGKIGSEFACVYYDKNYCLLRGNCQLKIKKGLKWSIILIINACNSE